MQITLIIAKLALGFSDLKLWVPTSQGRHLSRRRRQVEYGSFYGLVRLIITRFSISHKPKWTSSAATQSILPTPTCLRPHHLLHLRPSHPKSRSTWLVIWLLSTHGVAVTREFYVFRLTLLLLWIPGPYL